MDLQSLITSQIQGAVLDKIATSSGVDTNTASSVTSAAIPLLLKGLQKNTATPKGAAALDKTLAKNHDGSILQNVGSNIGTDLMTTEGSKILGHIFGAKTDTVAKSVSKQTGATPSAVNSILGTLAPIVLGNIGKTKRDQGLNSQGIGDLLGGQKLKSSGGLLGTINDLLDSNNNGSALDDIIGFFGKK
jgi:hypothetical protein